MRKIFAAIGILVPIVVQAHPHYYGSYSYYTNPVVIDNTHGSYSYYGGSSYTTVRVIDATGGQSYTNGSDADFAAFLASFDSLLQGLSDDAKTALAEALLLGRLPTDISASVRDSIAHIFDRARSFSFLQRLQLARRALASRASSAGRKLSELAQSILDRGDAGNDGSSGLLQSILNRSSSSTSGDSTRFQPGLCNEPRVKNSIFGPIPDTNYCGIFGPVPTHEELFYPNGR